MAYAMTKQGSLDNCITYEFICDTVADMNAIKNKYRTIGTVAIVLSGESGIEVYIADSNKQWNSLISVGGETASGNTTGLAIHICTQNEVSNGLPDIEEPDETTIYLIAADNTTGNLYEEYIYVNDAWEKFGTASTDLSNYIQKTDIATQNTAGLVKILDNGNVTFNENNQLVLTLAGTAVVKTGQSDHPISVTHQHEAAFYGLAKAAGQDMKNSNNAVGTYTTEAAGAIRTMIGAGTYNKPAGGIPAADLAETYLTSHQDISGKANSADLATVATSGSYNDLSNKPTIPTIPTNVSAFTNDAGYLTQHQDITGKVDKEIGKGLSSNDYTDGEKAKLGNIPAAPVADGNYILKVNISSGTATYSWVAISDLSGVTF